MRFLTGAQGGIGSGGLVMDIPLPGQGIPPENVGLASSLKPRTKIGIQLHYVNPSRETILREAWINFHTIPKEQVKVLIEPIFFIGGLDMNVPTERGANDSVTTKLHCAGECS